MPKYLSFTVAISARLQKVVYAALALLMLPLVVARPSQGRPGSLMGMGVGR